MSRVMSLCVGRTAHATGSIALLPGRSCRWSGRHLGPAVVRSGPTEYVSGPLGNSDLLRRLAAEQKAKEDAERGEKRRKGTATSVVSTEVVAKAGSPDPTFDVVTYIDEEEDDDEDDGAELLSELSDEGWQADIIDDDTVVREGSTLFDLRSDPMFSSLSTKSIEILEKHLENDRKQKKRDMDESSLTTKTKAAPHRKLRIIGGEFGGRRLLSPQGRFVRPMMERVRAAIFNMLFSHTPGSGFFRANARWLDLYAGTGAVGLEALSRGCEDVHFVEIDPWVVSAVLKKNIEECGCSERSTVRTMKVEQYLDRLVQLPQYRTGPFDFVSVCPPYQQVSYPDLQQQIENAGIVDEHSVIFMEYPRQLSHQIRDSIGGLKKIKDRKYGRTYLAVYASE